MNGKPNAKKFKLKFPLSKYFGNVARRLRKAALAQGQNLHNNGDLVRLMRFTPTKEGTSVNLRVEPTDYSTFMATNLSLDKVMWPVGKAGKNVSLVQYCGNGLLKLDNPCMANALNVIAMIVTTDGFTFLPRRSSAVYERPNTVQASVGGFVRYTKDGPEPPLDALKREIREEWGIKVTDSECRFLAFGINRLTGEPDLIAIVKTGKTFEEVVGSHARLKDKFEFTNLRTMFLGIDRIDDLVLPLVSETWSQPSDRAAYLMMLFTQFPQAGAQIEGAIRKLPRLA